MPKELRAELHERFADWLEARPLAFPAIMDELLGYHVERAVLLRRELGETEDATAALASRASAYLGAAGLRAAQRDDPSTASTLLERATALAAHDDDAAWRAAAAARGVALRGGTARRGNRRPRRGDRPRAGTARRPPAPESSASSSASSRRRTSGPSAPGAVADEALTVLVREGDQAGQCRAWYLRAQAAWIAGRVGQADTAWCEAAVCARLAGDERELFRILGMRATAAVLGPTPVDEAIAPLRGFRELVGASPVAAALMVNPLASLHAMRGEFELADGFLREADETLDQLGSLGWVSHHGALVRLLEGQPGLAERPLREAVDRLASMGDGELLATTLAMLAQAVYAQGQIDEAEQLCRMAAGAGAPDDIVTQVIWRGVTARILAGAWPGRRGRGARPRRGRARRADRLALLPRRCDARPRRRTAVEFPHRCVSRRG